MNQVSDLKEGMVCPGIVTNVTNFGAFVDVGVHQDGLVHISQLSSTRFVKDPREVVNPGDRVQVKVLAVDLAKQRISLTMRLGEPVAAPAPRGAPRGAARRRRGRARRARAARGAEAAGAPRAAEARGRPPLGGPREPEEVRPAEGDGRRGPARLSGGVASTRAVRTTSRTASPVSRRDEIARGSSGTARRTWPGSR